MGKNIHAKILHGGEVSAAVVIVVPTAILGVEKARAVKKHLTYFYLFIYFVWV